MEVNNYPHYDERFMDCEDRINYRKYAKDRKKILNGIVKMFKLSQKKLNDAFDKKLVKHLKELRKIRSTQNNSKTKVSK